MPAPANAGVFPEGTPARTRLPPFKLGAFVVAAHTGVPITGHSGRHAPLPRDGGGYRAAARS
jgi:hypothetical protein